jgi:large subunit ribosomal protein L16
MLFPKKVKHRKWHKTRRNLDKIGTDTRGTTVAYGSYGLKTTTYARINSRQLEAARRVIKRASGKFGRVWIRVFPDRPYTKKPAEIKMGKGKGGVEGYEVEVKPGRVLFEVDGVSEEVAREALRKGGTKLPVKTRVIGRDLV